MPFDLHTVEMVDGSTMTLFDRLTVLAQYNVASGATGSTTSVAVAVSFAYPLPASYGVQVTPISSAPLAVAISNKTQAGFTATLTALSGDVPAGTSFDLLVTA